MKFFKTLILFASFLLISCTSTTSNNNNENTSTKPFIEVDSFEVRVSSRTRSEQFFMHLNLLFKTNIDTITYVKLNVFMKDKYDKVWLDENIMVKDKDCNFKEMCKTNYETSYYANSHNYYSSKFGKSYNTLDLVLMNSDDFEYFRKDSLYKGQVVNYNRQGKKYYDQILVPDVKIKVIGYK